MMKLKAANLADVFGWMNVKARDFADSFGNLIGSRENVAKVAAAAEKAGEHTRSVRGTFEIAANAWRRITQPQTSGRAYNPTFGFPTRSLNLG